MRQNVRNRNNPLSVNIQCFLVSDIKKIKFEFFQKKITIFKVYEAISDNMEKCKIIYSIVFSIILYYLLISFKLRKCFVYA